MAIAAPMGMEEDAHLSVAVKQSKNAKIRPCDSHKYYFSLIIMTYLAVLRNNYVILPNLLGRSISISRWILHSRSVN